MKELRIYFVKLRVGSKKVLGIAIHSSLEEGIEQLLSFYKDSEFDSYHGYVTWNEFKAITNDHTWPEYYLLNNDGLFPEEEFTAAAEFVRDKIMGQSTNMFQINQN